MTVSSLGRTLRGCLGSKQLRTCYRLRREEVRNVVIALDPVLLLGVIKRPAVLQYFSDGDRSQGQRSSL